MSNVTCHLTNNSLVVIVNGKSVSISRDTPLYGLVCSKINDGIDEDDLAEVLDKRTNFHSYVAVKNMEYKDGKVYYKGEELENEIVDRINDTFKEGLPIEPWLLVLENLEQNPSYKARKQFPKFIVHKELPITDDGYIIAYKAVTKDFLDKYTETIDNSPGVVVKYDRSGIDDDDSIACSEGLHAGAIDYVKSYGNSNDVIILVKIHPKDFVSVPKDHSFQKCRVCEYLVLRVMDEVFDSSVVDSTAELLEVEMCDEEINDEVWEEEYDYDEDEPSVHLDEDDDPEYELPTLI